MVFSQSDRSQDAFFNDILSKMFHIGIHSNPFIFVLFLFRLFLFLFLVLLLLLLLKVLNLTPLYDVSYRLCVHSIVAMNKWIGTESMKRYSKKWKRWLRKTATYSFGSIRDSNDFSFVLHLNFEYATDTQTKFQIENNLWILNSKFQWLVTK